MQLKVFKPLWGHVGDLECAIKQAVAAGFDGIEGGAPADLGELTGFRQALERAGLGYIAEVTTAGSYVPRRQAGLDEHLYEFQARLEQALPLNPLFVSCLGGCDAWPEALSVDFFERAIRIADDAGIDVSFETHRSRSLFNPWVTQRIVRAIPHLKLTADYSHWCVVCERLMDTEPDALLEILPKVHHIHARVGYEQGPQIPHPGADEYAYALQAHESWWRDIWASHHSQTRPMTTMTPEFGPDGYLHHIPFSNQPVGDLWQINCWMAERQRNHFHQWSKFLTQPENQERNYS